VNHIRYGEGRDEDTKEVRIIWSLWLHARNSGLTIVAGAPTAVAGFGIVWARGCDEPWRKSYESWLLIKARIWVLQAMKLPLESLMLRLWFMLGWVKITFGGGGLGGGFWVAVEATEAAEAVDLESEWAIDQDVCLWYGSDTMIELRYIWLFNLAHQRVLSLILIEDYKSLR
jgi:hypothetical protein